MTLPTTFANLNQATGGQLDDNFAALGKITPIHGVIAGTDALTLTPQTDTPSVDLYETGNIFVGVAAGTNTAAVTLAVGGLGALSVYKDTSAGPAALSPGDIFTGNAYGFIYDAALSGGAGGFHLQQYAAVISLQATLTFSNTPANTTSEVSITAAGFSLAKVGDMVMIGPPTSVISGVMYMGYVAANGTINVRAANVTAASLTPTGGTFRIGVRGAGS